MAQYSRSLWIVSAFALVALAQCGGPMPMTEAGPPPAMARLLSEAGNVAMCPPGATYTFSCSPACNDGARSCANSPVIRVCDAARTDMECMVGAAGVILGEGSANCGGSCQGVTVACPDQGVVKLAGYNAGGGIFVCEARGRAVTTGM